MNAEQKNFNSHIIVRGKKTTMRMRNFDEPLYSGCDIFRA